MMAVSQVSICSNALLILGSQPISSMDESNDRARLCNSLYDFVLNDLLRQHFWNCAVKRISLSADVAAPVFDYTYQYTLPSDWLRMIQVGEYGYEVDYRIEGTKLLTDEGAPLYIRYVYKNTDPGTWDSMLVQAMTLAMAARMAYAITQSASMEQTRAQELMAFMKQARAIDGQDDPPETLGDFRLLAVRYGAG